LPQAEEIRKMFGSIVGRYDLLNRLLSLGLDRKWRAALARSLKAQAPGTVLDLCCGTGDLGLAVLEHAGEAELLVAADFSLPMCRAARSKLSSFSLGGPAWACACADSLRLPFADRVFDSVSVAFGVRNFEDMDQGLAEIFRVTRPGGSLYILEFAPPEGFLLRTLYRPYLKLVPPLLGRLVAGAGVAYSYLSSSIESFLRPEAMLKALASCGFQNPKAAKLTLGITYLYTARR